MQDQPFISLEEITMSNNTQKVSVATATILNGGKPSIRQICMEAILGSVREPDAAKELKATAKALVERYYPTSMAAAKFDKHYAWYKGTMKKAGELNLQD